MNAKLVQISRVLLSVLFIFSGISKLISLPFFDDLVAELLIGPDYYSQPTALWWVQLLTRVIISAEMLLGTAVLQEKHLKNVVIPTIQLLLLMFTVHLFYDSLQQANGFIEGNCGCFGEIIPMNNLESIIKNVVAMILGAIVWRFYKEEEMRFRSWVIPVGIGAVCFATLWLTIKEYDSVEEVKTSENLETVVKEEIPKVEKNDTIQELIISKETEQKKIEKSKPNDIKGGNKKKEVVVDEQPKQELPEERSITPGERTKSILMDYAIFEDNSKLNLNEGEQIICIFNLTCTHCQQAYKDLCDISEDGDLPKMYLYLYGAEFTLNYFFNQAGGRKNTYVRTDDFAAFKRMLEGDPYPRILAFKDGKLIKSWKGDDYSEEAVRSFYGIEKKEKKKEQSNEKELKLGEDDTSPW